MDCASYMSKHMVGYRLCAAQNFRTAETDWIDFVKSKQVCPSYEYGYRHAHEPTDNPVPPEKGAKLSELVRLAMNELDTDFDADDVIQLLDGAGFDRNNIRARISLEAKARGMSLGYRKTGKGKPRVYYFKTVPSSGFANGVCRSTSGMLTVRKD